MSLSFCTNQLICSALYFFRFFFAREINNSGGSGGKETPIFGSCRGQGQEEESNISRALRWSTTADTWAWPQTH